MAGNGPRVGGAHVGVGLEADMGSITKVGKRIHKQLSDMGERNKKAYQQLGASAVTAWRSALGAIVSSAPLIGSATSALAGGATVIAGAFVSAAQSAASMVTVLGSVAVAAGTAVIAFKGFGTAISAANPEELAKALQNLAPNARSSALAVRSLKDEAHALRLTVQDTMFEGLSGPIRELSTTLLPVAEAGLDKMAFALNGLARGMLGYVNSSSGLKQISTTLDGTASIFDRLTGAAVPGLDGILRLFNALIPAGERLADRIVGVAQSFQLWTQGAGFADRIDASMQRAEKTAGLLFTVLGNLGGALANVFTATNPATNEFLKMLVGITQKFQEWTGSVAGQDTIAKWASQSVDVMRQFGETAGAAFELVAELADPRIITSFLTTLQAAFEHLSKLPLDSIVSGFASVLENLEPVSGVIAAVVIAGAGLGVMFGNLVGQIGGAVLVFGKLKGAGAGLSGFFGRFAGMGKHATAVGKFTAVFRDLAGVISKGLKFAGVAGLVVWIGVLIAKSQSLQDKVKNAFNEFKGVFSALGGAFSEISAALSPVVSGLQPVFDVLNKIATLAIGVVIDMIAGAFKGLASVITGVGSIIAGFITTIKGIFTLFTGGGFGGLIAGLKQMFSGLGPLLQGVWLLFLNVFGPAKLLKLGMVGLRGLWTGIKSVIPMILTGIGALGGLILQGLKALPGKMMSFGAKAITFLWQAFKTGMPKLLALAGRIVVGVVKFIAKLPGRLLTLGKAAITKLASAVGTGVAKLGPIAGRIVVAIVKFIAKLPGRLLTLGKAAITKLASAVSKGISKLSSIAGRIVSGIVKFLSKLPGKLLSLGRSAVSKLASAVSAGIGKLTSIAGRIVSGIVNFISKLPGRLLSIGQSAISRLASAVSGGIGRLRSIASRIVSAVVDTVSSLPGKMLSIGRNIVSNIAQGIRNAIGMVTSAIDSVAQSVKDRWPLSPVKKGPLTAWNYGNSASGAGRTLMSDLADGIQSQIGGVVKASSAAAYAFKKPFRTGVIPSSSLSPLPTGPTGRSPSGTSPVSTQASFLGLEITGTLDTPWGPAQVRGIVKDELTSQARQARIQGAR